MDGTAENMHDPAEPPEHDPPETPAVPAGLLISGYFQQYVPYHAFRRHGTADWVLMYTLRGRGLIQQPGGVRHDAVPGDLVLLEPGAYHDYGCVPGVVWDFVWAHFITRPSWLTLLRWPEIGKGLFVLGISDSAARRRIRAAFFRCHDDSHAGRGGVHDDLAMNALEEVLLLAAREHAADSDDRRLTANVRRVVEHLDGHLHEPHTVASLAKIARLSPSRMAHRFKEETGDSVIGYLLKLRLKRAAKLLEFSGRRVKEAAADVGFASEFYFSRQFKAFFGVSPRQYQQRVSATATRTPKSENGKDTNSRSAPSPSS
jgi:AraC family transcriptional regulator, arabinose operon regulatory protein